MFTNKPKREETGLEVAIDQLLRSLSNIKDAHSPEHIAIVDQLDKLYKLKDVDRLPRVSPDTLALIAANLFGIVIIMSHERTSVIATKALTYAKKLK